MTPVKAADVDKSPTLTKSEKKRLKKQKQKAKAGEESQNKVEKNIKSIGEYFGMAAFELCETYLEETFKLSPNPEQSLKLIKYRLQVSISLNKSDAAVKDLKKILELEPTNDEMVNKFCKYVLHNCDIDTWNKFSKNSSEKVSSNKKIAETREIFVMLDSLQTKAKLLERGNDYSGALDRVTECLGYCPSSKKTYPMESKVLALSKKPDECETFVMKAITNKVLQDDNSPEQSFIKGICLYYSDDFELKGVYDYFFEAQKELKEADLWFKKVKEMRESIDKIKDNFDKNRKKDAIQVATKALKIDPSHKKFNFNILNKRAALNKLCDWQERAIEDLTQAIAID